MCKKIHRGGNAEQYNADKKYKEAVAVAVEACADDGFASTARSAAVPAAIAWLKLEALGAGVKLARERVANANAVCRSPLKLAAVGFRVCVIRKYARRAEQSCGLL